MPGYHKKPKGYVSDAQRKAVHASKKDGGKGNPNKPKMVAPVKTKKKVYAKMDKRRGSVPTLAQRQAKAIKEYNKLPDKEKVNKTEFIKMKMRQANIKKYSRGTKPMAKFPDLSGDGKITKKDILMGRGVIDKPKMLRKKRKNYA